MSQFEEGSNSSAHRGDGGGSTDKLARYKGVRRRQWGKWVSEIRVPGTSNRLWLGSYATAEAAAVAHDAAVFFLRGPLWSNGFNFPDRVERSAWANLSPRSVQKVANEWGMAVDSEIVARALEAQQQQQQQQSPPVGAEIGGGNGGTLEGLIWGDISVDDMEIYM